jgi:O-antigen/teichoic acid export membrane protein
MEYGTFSVAVQAVVILNVIFDFGLGVAFVRHGSNVTTERRFELARNVLLLRMTILTASTGLLALFLASAEWLSDKTQLEARTLVLAFLTGMLLSLWGHYRYFLQATGEFSKYALYVLSYAGLRIAGAFALLSDQLQANAYSAVLVLYTIPVALLILIQLVTVRSRPQVSSLAQWKSDAARLLGYSKHIAVSSLAYPVISSCPLFLVAPLDPVAFRAEYGLSLAFASIVAPVNEAVRAVLLRKVSTIKTPVEAVNLIAFYKRAAPAIGLVAVSLIAAVVGFFRFYLSEQYPNAELPILILLTASLLTAFLGSINSMAHFLARPDWDAKNNIARVCVVSLSCLLLAESMTALSCALLVSAVLVSGETTVFLRILKEIRQRGAA